MTRTKLGDRILPEYTRKEELINMISHIVGGAMGIVVTVLCAVIGALHQSAYSVVGGVIFGATMILLYTMSAIYHGLSPEKMAKKVFQIFDHCAIFLLIAGTYTPLTLCTIRSYNPALGWAIFGLIWGMAVLGIVFNSIDLKKFRKFSMVCYLGMGWCVIITIGDLVKIFPAPALALLISGGLSYTLGSALYVAGKKKKYMHSLFHLFVVLGSLLHSLFIMIFVI